MPLEFQIRTPIASLALLSCLVGACGIDDSTQLSPQVVDEDVCDGLGCTMTLARFQSRDALTCEADLDGATALYDPATTSRCATEFFTCEGLDAVAYLYSSWGDNVQCFYGDDGQLVGARQETDHGHVLAGQVPETRCFSTPGCFDDGASSDAGADGGD